MKNTQGGVLLYIKLQACSLKVTKANTPQWVFFTFFKLYKWHQIVQCFSFSIGKVLVFNTNVPVDCRYVFVLRHWAHSIQNGVVLFI